MPPGQDSEECRWTLTMRITVNTEHRWPILASLWGEGASGAAREEGGRDGWCDERGHGRATRALSLRLKLAGYETNTTPARPRLRLAARR